MEQCITNTKEMFIKSLLNKLNLVLDLSRSHQISNKWILDFSSFGYVVSSMENFYIEDVTNQELDGYINEEIKLNHDKECLNIIPNHNLDVSLDISAEELLDNMKAWNKIKIQRITYWKIQIETEEMDYSDYRDLEQFLWNKKCLHAELYVDLGSELDCFFDSFDNLRIHFNKIMISVSDEAYEYLKYKSRIWFSKIFRVLFKDGSFPQLLVLRFEELKCQAEPLSNKSLMINKSNRKRAIKVVQELLNCVQIEDYVIFSKNKMSLFKF